MELREVITLDTIGRVTAVPAFNLIISPCKSFFLCFREKHFEVLCVKYHKVAPGTSFSRCVLEYPSDWPTETLTKHRSKIFDSIKLTNHMEALLEGKWDPSVYIDKPSPRLVKAEFSPRSKNRVFLAVLMTSGAFHLYRRTVREWTPCCNLATKYIEELARGPITTYTGFREALGCTEIVSFDWLPCSSSADTIELLCVTKNGSLVLIQYDAEAREPRFFEQRATMENVDQIKIIQSNNNLLAIVATMEGELALYQLERRKGRVNLKKTADLWPEKDGITVNGISYAFNGNNLRVSVAKGFHLLIFQLNEDLGLEGTIIEQFPSPFITGIHVIDYAQLVVSVVNQKIYYGNVVEGKLQLVEIKDNYKRNFSCTGVIGCKNRGIYILAFTASKPHDSSILKAPERLILSTFSKYNAFNEVLDDPEMRISNHLEYFEMMRFHNKSIASEFNRLMERIGQEPNENMERVRYYLKVQLFLQHGALNDRSVPEKAANVGKKENFIRDMIQAIVFHRNLAVIVEKKSDRSEDQLMANRSLRTALTGFLRSDDRHGYLPFVERLKGYFAEAIEKSKSIGKDLKSDNCYLCDQEIVNGRLTCVQCHQVNRCCFTNLQIPILATPHCRICGAQSLDKDELREVLGTDLEQPICPFCDVEIQ